jgi:hypothetical protein
MTDNMDNQTSSTAAPAPPPTGKTTLYVIFHGLWIFETRADKILAHTCIEEDHDIVAGYVDYNQPSAPTLKELVPGTLKLIHTGHQPRTTNQFHDDLNIVLKNIRFALPSKRFCVIEMPLPRQIQSARSTPPDNPPTIPYGGIDGEKLRPIKVSLAQILLYTVLDPSKVQLVPLGITPKYDASTDTAKLHIFAQPSSPMADMMGRFHVRDAYSKLAMLFGLDIVPLAPAFIRPSDPGLKGLTINDMLNRGEMPPMSPEEGDSGSNCDPLVIDNSCLDDPE